MPTTFFMLEAIVKGPMTALEKKLISMNTRTGQGFTALSTFANHQETVSISVFSTVLTVQEEIIQSEVAAVNDEVDEGSMPWRFFKFTEPSMHGKVESVLRKNCLKPLTEPLWFRQAEPAVLVSFWTTEGQSQSFALSQFCFKQKPADSWPVDVAVSPVAACGQLQGAQLCLAGQEDEVELFGGFGSFPGVGSRSSISGSLQISESDTETVSAAKDDLADFVDAPQAGQRWNPGKDVGRHILRGLYEQGQILVINLMLNLAKLSPQVLKSISESLPPVSPIRPLNARVAGQLLCMSGNTLKGILHRVKNNDWVPHKPSVDGSSADAVVGDGQVHALAAKSPRDARSALTSLVREAVSTVGNARPDGDFLEAITRLQKHGVDVGDKYCSSNNLGPCLSSRWTEHLGAKCLEQQQASDLLARLDGLGVRSPCALAFDSVTIANSMFARQETLQIITMSTFSAATGRLQNHFVASPAIGLSHDGVSQATSVLEALARHEAHLTAESLRRRVVTIIGGDSGNCKGGDDARHSSTQSGNRLQALLYPDQTDLEATEWERFHRSEAAFRASLNESEASKELFSVARALSQLFGCGSGRVLLRCIQAFDSDSSAPAAAQMSGTRQGEAITRIAGTW
eukprot:s402_g15.t2